MSRVAGSLMIVVVLGVAISACSPDRVPSATEKTSSSPQSTASTSASVAASTPSPSSTTAVAGLPEPPDALRAKPSEDAAVEVATYFLNLYPYVYGTGDLKAWNKLSDAECVFCKSVRDNVKAATAAGTHDVGGAIDVTKVHSRVNVPGEFYEVVVDFVQRESKTVDALGKELATYPEDDSSRASVIVHWSDEGWAVRGVDVKAIEQ